MSLIIRTIQQLFQQFSLLPTDLLIFRRPTAIGSTKDYKVTVEDFTEFIIDEAGIGIVNVDGGIPTSIYTSIPKVDGGNP